MTMATALRQPAARVLSILISILFASLLSPALQAEEHVIVQLPWQHQFQFAGYYAAIAKGFYHDVGLQVTLREPSENTNVVDEVVSGRAQFGISGSDLLLDRAAGHPVVVLAAILQHSPLVLLTLDRPDISHPRDLTNKVLMLKPGSNELLSYLIQQTKQHKWELKPNNQRLQQLVNGEVDAISAYHSYEPFHLQQQGIPYRVFSPNSNGLGFYGDNLFTSERELFTYPDLVYAFQQATLKGWRYAIDHPEEMINLILTEHPTGAGREQLAFEARETKALMQPDLIEPGYMQRERWEQIARTYLEVGMLKVLPNLEHFIYDPAQERLQQQQKLRDKSMAVVLLISFTLVILLGIFLYLYIRLRKEAQARQQLTLELTEREQHYRFVAENSADVIWTMDVNNMHFHYVSPAIAKLTGYQASELFVLPLEQLLPDASRARLHEEVLAALSAWRQGHNDQTRRVARASLRHKQGHLVVTETTITLHSIDGAEPEAILGVTRDITKQAEQEALMHRLAFYDPLTGLPNRRLLQQRLNELLDTQTPRPLALLFIDLDHFKPINDTFGHETGDILLKLVAERISHCISEQGLVVRLGGDEFVILLPDPADKVLNLAEQLHQLLSDPFQVAGQALLISCSIGVALAPEHANDAKTLMQHADLAMYHAKHQGRGMSHVYCGKHDWDERALPWNDEHECGHPLIDAEHRELFTLTNQLLHRMKDHHDNPVLF
ncbi:MAG: diguanylate cyclase domain-containing protein, partial [Aeromonas sp.]